MSMVREKLISIQQAHRQTAATNKPA